MLHDLRRYVYEVNSFASSPRRAAIESGPVRRIGYFTHNLRSQGAQNSLLEIAGAVHNTNQFVARVYSPGDDVLRKAYERRGIEVSLFARPNAGEPDKEQYQRNLQKLSTWIAKEELDLIHANTVQAFYVIQAARLAGIPCVWNIRESDPPEELLCQQPPHLAEACRSSFMLADAVIFVSRSSKDNWEGAVHVNEPYVFHNSLNPSTWAAEIAHHDRYALRSALKLKVEDKLILTTGTVSERKAQLDLIRAVGCDTTILEHSCVAIVGMNSAAYACQLIRLVDQLPAWARDRIFLIKERPIAEIVPYYLAADIFAFCSRRESFPRSLLEAFIFGLPTITTACNGVPELVSQNINGLFYAEGDHVQLARCIRRLVEDRELFLSMRQAAWTQSREHRSFADMVDAYKRIYNRLTPSNSPVSR